MKGKATVPHTYFEYIERDTTLKGTIWVGTSACFIDDDGNMCVLTCPNEKILIAFWNKLNKEALDITLCKTTMANAGCLLPENQICGIPYVAEAPKVVTKPLKIAKPKKIDKVLDDKGLFDGDVEEETQQAVWLYDKNKDECQINFQKDVYPKGVSEIGLAKRKTINECRILLRQLGWEREEILETKISDIDWTDDIPW